MSHGSTSTTTPGEIEEGDTKVNDIRSDKAKSEFDLALTAALIGIGALLVYIIVLVVLVILKRMGKLQIQKSSQNNSFHSEHTSHSMIRKFSRTATTTDSDI